MHWQLEGNQINSGIRGTISAAVDGNSPFLNQSVHTIETGFQIDVIALMRKGTVILPPDNLVIEEADILLYQTRAHVFFNTNVL